MAGPEQNLPPTPGDPPGPSDGVPGVGPPTEEDFDRNGAYDETLASPAGDLSGYDEVDASAGTVFENREGKESSKPNPGDPFARGTFAAGNLNQTQTFGRYEVRDTIGQGGFGTVYLGYDTQLHREVAIKAPRFEADSAEVQQQFFAEARQLAKLNHPGIVSVFDIGIDGSQCYIVSSYLAGDSLAKILKHRRYSWQESIRIIAAIADALAHAHAQRVVHRDLKPANIIMTDAMTPVIVDFGLGLSDAQMTGDEKGVIAGTPSYMSPEQTRGEAHRIDGRTDIYTLGVILYRMLTGRLPFQAKNVGELLRQVQEDEPQPPRQLVSEIPRDVERICLKAMDKHLRHRYTTAGDMAEELLEQIVSSGGTVYGKTLVVEKSELASTADEAALGDAADRSNVDDSLGMDSSPSEQQSGGVSKFGTASDSFLIPSSSTRSHEALRRRVTLVLCGCDVFTSEEIVESLGMEEQQEVLQSFQELCRKVATECSGAEFQETTDGILICFGYPIAMEDASLRAVRCGRQLLEQTEELNRRLQRKYRVGIKAFAAVHCDQAIVQDKGVTGGGLSIVGQVINVIKQLDQIVEPDTVVATEDVHRMLSTRFQWEELGPKPLRGVGQKTLYRVIGERTSAGQADEEIGGMTPLIGRNLEVGLLQERWEQATEGMGQVVLLIGEAGLGKSRLVQTLKMYIRPDAGLGSGLSSKSSGVGESSRALKQGVPTIIEWRSSPQYQSSSLYPVINYMERRCGFSRGDIPAVKLDKLVNQLAALNLDSNEQIALLASLLSIPLGDRYPALALDPQRQKERTFDLIGQWIRELVHERPVLFIIEDLHWVDPTTLEFVEGFISQGLNDSILTLLTFRPEFTTPWQSMAHQTQIALNRLTRRQIGEMVAVKAGAENIPQHVIDQIAERTDGVPLFVEEFTRMVIESDKLMNVEESSASVSASSKSSIHSREIPATLQDLLMARLDRIDANIEVVQLGAAIGRDFSHELLMAVSPMNQGELQTQLDKLVKAEVLIVRGRPPRTHYQFKHALIQDAAYGSLIKQQRQLFHHRIAETLESQFSELATTQPELLAQHFTEAGESEKGIDYWDRAGQRALDRRAHKEAIQHLSQGLDLLQNQPESPERFRQELRMHTALGIPLQATIGYSAPEVEQTYARAHELCGLLGITTEQFPVLYGMFRYYMLQAKYPKARELGEQLLTIAEQTQTPHYLVAASRARGGPPVYEGHHADAVTYLEQVVAIDPTPELRAEVNRFDVVDPWIASRSYLSWATWLLGHPDQSLAHSDEAVRIADGLDHSFSAALAISFSQWVHQFRRDVSKTRATAEKALAIAREHGFAFWYGWCGVMRGWADAQKGKGDEAIAEIRKGIADWRAQGSELGCHYYFVLLAEACIKGNRVDEAHTALDDAARFAAETGEGFFAPEIPRLRGKLLLKQDASATSDAEKLYREALELSREQQARSLELRAAASLARLLQKQGNADAARELLFPIVDWFTEGLDTYDIKEAKRLLESL